MLSYSYKEVNARLGLFVSLNFCVSEMRGVCSLCLSGNERERGRDELSVVPGYSLTLLL